MLRCSSVTIRSDDVIGFNRSIYCLSLEQLGVVAENGSYTFHLLEPLVSINSTNYGSNNPINGNYGSNDQINGNYGSNNQMNGNYGLPKIFVTGIRNLDFRAIRNPEYWKDKYKLFNIKRDQRNTRLK